MQVIITLELDTKLEVEIMLQKLSIYHADKITKVEISDGKTSKEIEVAGADDLKNCMRDSEVVEDGMRIRREKAIENLGGKNIEELREIARKQGFEEKEVQIGKTPLILKLKQQLSSP